MLGFDTNDLNQRHAVVVVEIEMDVRITDKI